MKTFIFSILNLVVLNICFAQPILTDSMYLGQTRPGNTALMFQLPVSSGTRAIERITISNDGKEFYYSEIDTYPPNVLRIKYYKYLSDRWQGPFVIFEGFMAPALSLNDSIIYMQNILNGTACTFFAARTGTGWGIPTRRLATNLATHYFQETGLNNYYVSTTFPGYSTRDISILNINGNDTVITNLGPPINTSANEGDFFIARDESYIIHARSTPSVPADLYISYKKADGSWTNSKLLGPAVNLPSPYWEYGPFVTQDNKYLFFSRGATYMTSYNTYWVRIDNIIDSLRHTNFIPYVKNIIPNQVDTIGRSYNYTFAENIFIDDDGSNTLTYSAALSGGDPLPSWLSFNPLTKTFSGTPNTAGTLSIKVTARDTAGAEASCTFTLDIIQQIGIEKINERIVKEYKLTQNYPNPFNPNTSITFDIPKASFTNLIVYDAIGREAGTLVNELLKAGSYKVNLNAGNLSSGIYFYKLETNNFTQTKKMILVK